MSAKKVIGSMLGGKGMSLEKKKKKKDGNPSVLNHFPDFNILIFIKER